MPHSRYGHSGHGGARNLSARKSTIARTRGSKLAARRFDLVLLERVVGDHRERVEEAHVVVVGVGQIQPRFHQPARHSCLFERCNEPAMLALRGRPVVSVTDGAHEAAQRGMVNFVIAGNRVRFYGSYRSAELPTLMRDVDWAVVPSIWWENSPIVIQESFFHGRPLICSNVGGMAEKITRR